MIKAVIFDIDGVLLDSYEANYRYFKRVGKLLDLKAPSRASFHKSFYYQPTREVFRMINKIQDVTEFDRKLKNARSKLTSHKKFEKLFEGSRESLQQLRKKYKLGLVTSRSKPGLDSFLKFYKTKIFFNVAIGLHHVKNHKPHPESLLLAAQKLKIKPAEAIYVGDAPTDLLAAILPNVNNYTAVVVASFMRPDKSGNYVQKLMLSSIGLRG